MKSKTTLLVLSFLFSSLQAFSQAPNWLWAKSASGTGVDHGYSISTDANGNALVTGYFASPTITFGTTTLTNAGIRDIFIVKYDASGNVLWAKSAGGVADDYGYSVATDANGSVLVTGWFDSPAITFGTTTLTNANTNNTADIFIVKYDASGNVLWAKSAGGTSYDEGYSVAIDAGGNVYVAGGFRSASITFGTTTLTNANTNNSPDIFIVKYDASGNVLWAKSVGGTGSDFGNSVATDAGGNVLVTGDFASPTITFGTTTLTKANTNNTYDIFIVRYDASGNVLWAKSAGGTSSDYGNSVATDAGGNVLVTGWFYSPSITFGTTTLIGSDDMFIVKYDASGNVLWAKSAGGTSGDEAYSVATDANGHVMVTGAFWSPSITFGTTTLTNAGLYDIFIVKYDASGNVLWAKSAGGTGTEAANSVATDAGGNIVVTGGFNSPSITFGTTVLTNAGGSDIFVARLAGPVTAVAEVAHGTSVHFYPNPVSKELKIRNEKLNIEGVEIMDAMGKTIFKSSITNPKSEISLDVSSLVPGIYFVAVRDERGNKMVRKFVKQ